MTWIVWQHKDGVVQAVGAWDNYAMADAYARYMNRRHSGGWFEVLTSTAADAARRES